MLRRPEDESRHTLRDGSEIRCRRIRPHDRAELARRFEELSERSRRARFFVSPRHLSESMLTYLTEVDGHDHVALAALVDSHDMKEERGVAIGRYVRLADEPSVAEVAVTVTDDYQGKGIGSVLLRELASIARREGIRFFRGFVLADNAPMLRMLTELDARPRGLEAGPDGDDVVVLDIDLTHALQGDDERPRSTDLLWQLFRRVAGAVRGHLDGLELEAPLAGEVDQPPASSGDGRDPSGTR